MKETIEKLLQQKLSASHVEVLDDSDLHTGHPEAVKSGGGHFSILVVSDQFEGKNLLGRHRMINDVLKDHLKNTIHALAIKAYTKNEYSSRN